MRSTFRLQHPFTLISILAVTLAANGCATLEKIIQKPTASFAEMKITNADLMQANAAFYFNVVNPNAINIRASRITYDLKINGRNFMSGELDKGITLVASSSNTLSIPVTLQYMDIFESITQLWKAQKADYAITGGFSVGPFRVPYQARGNFDLPKRPKISLEAIEIENYSLQGAKLNCRLKMDNPNAFDLLFKRLEYHLKLDGTSIADASALSQGPLTGNSNSDMNFGLDISFAQLGMSVYKLLEGNKGNFTLDGDMVLDSPSGKENTVPFSITGQVPFVR